MSNSYGSPTFIENNCWWLVINDLCRKAIENNEIRLKSDGSPLRDFIHGNDVVSAIQVLIETKENFDENIINIASGTTCSILELAHNVSIKYKEKYNKEIPVVLNDNTVSESLPTFQSKQKFYIDISKIKQLGFKQKTSISEGISEIFNYLEEISLFSNDNQ